MDSIVDFFGKIVLAKDMLEALRQARDYIKNRVIRPQDKVKVSEAITAIQRAVIRTRSFIANSGFAESTELSDLWLEAMNKVVVARISNGLPEYLYHKARFWGRPQDWLRNDTSLELVPLLDEIEEECNGLLELLK
jgi:hypothetical protein